jgi:hypothetical protein
VKRPAALFLVGSLLTAPCVGQDVSADLVKPEVIQQRLEAGVVAGSVRQAAIRQLFTQVGCAVEEQRVDKKSANVICTHRAKRHPRS